MKAAASSDVIQIFPDMDQMEDASQPSAFRPPITPKAASMPATNLLVSIPSIHSKNALETPSSLERVGAFLMARGTQGDADNRSELSSICHSPNWDDAETKKTKKLKREEKEKRKKEKARAEKEARHKARPKKRLTKAPPSNYSKMLKTADQSSLAPTLSSAPAEKMRGLKWMNPKGNIRLDDTSSAQDSQASSQPPSFEHFRVSRASDGFIGGVKLKQADVDTVLQKIRRHTSVEQNTLEDTARALDGNPHNRLKKPMSRNGHQSSKSIDFSERVDDLSSHHADNNPIPIERDTPRAKTMTSIMDRPIKRGYRGKNDNESN
jgi:hypothetical protein